jgi:hypothetical protein
LSWDEYWRANADGLVWSEWFRLYLPQCDPGHVDEICRRYDIDLDGLASSVTADEREQEKERLAGIEEEDAEGAWSREWERCHVAVYQKEFREYFTEL